MIELSQQIATGGLLKEFIIFLSLLVSLGALATVMDKHTKGPSSERNTQYLPHQQQRMEDTETDGEPKRYGDDKEERSTRRGIRRVSPPEAFDTHVED